MHKGHTSFELRAGPWKYSGLNITDKQELGRWNRIGQVKSILDKGNNICPGLGSREARQVNLNERNFY